jgi:glycosyltransferase involved in cell wall biosynthesis
MNQPLLSVIVPCYNVEKYVDKCISSIVGQTYPHLEILLIDDGSTDRTGILCDVWQEKDKRIRVIHKQNEGLSYARKTGIENATAEYVSFVDSDDWIDAGMFSRLMQALLSTNSDIAQCGYRKIFEDGRIEHCNTAGKAGSFEIVGRKKGVLLILDGRIWDSFLWNKIFKTRLFEHIEFPKGRTYEDIPIMFWLFHHASQSVYLFDEYYNYFQRSNSITQETNIAKKMKNRSDFYEAYHERTQFVEQHPEYHSILCYMRNFEMYAGMYALRDAVAYPQHFPDHYFETLSAHVKSFPFSLKPKRLKSSPFPVKAIVPYFILVELLILKRNPRWYRRFRLFYSKHPGLEKFLHRFDG